MYIGKMLNNNVSALKGIIRIPILILLGGITLFMSASVIIAKLINYLQQE